MPGVNVSVIGSNRPDSINRKLARALIRLADGKLAASFVQIADLPMYSQDLESLLPASVAWFKASVEEVAALLFVSSEHNRSIPVVLKNAIDWGTRPHGRNSSGGRALPSLARRREPSARQWRNSNFVLCSVSWRLAAKPMSRSSQISSMRPRR
jgi:NAD(P)H-dependent FMN reductase